MTKEFESILFHKIRSIKDFQGNKTSKGFHKIINEFFELILTLEPMETAAWACVLMANYKVTFDTHKVPLFDTFANYTKSAMTTQNAKLSLAQAKVLFLIETMDVEEKHGKNAAMLYKLSQGNMDPRTKTG